MIPGHNVLSTHIDKIANRLLDGQFKNQKHAQELLLDYKILSSLPFSIEGLAGTQFKNIVRMNYLTEVLKEKFPKKIDPHFRIPHIIDHKEFDERQF